MLGAGWSGHKLRHRFATTAYAAERDLLAVQQLLGHSRPEVTARYTALPGDAPSGRGARASMAD
ncbi:MAG: site-specific integrase [Nocardioidaceae bacterium]|nr:site-specific integrase [Nocardioidaceae bacterium]